MQTATQGDATVKTAKLAWAIAALLLITTNAHARRIYKEFNYDFDTGGETHGFTHNEPDRGELLWHAGGALNSIGSLKVTGPNASLERYEWFQAGESTISFHYYVEGYRRLQCRLNVATIDDQRDRYGSYGRHYIDNLPQGRWQFVQLKVTDVVGGAKSKPKGWPELVFKSLTIIADRPNGAAYLLIDNIRLGPPIKEEEIVVRKREKQDFGKKKILLLDFEQPGDEKLIRPLEDLAVSRSDAWAATGKHSLKFICVKDRPWTAFELDQSLLKGWKEYDYMSFDFYSEAPHFIRFCPEFWDQAAHNYHTRSTFEGQTPGMRVKPVHKGKTRILVDLRRARRNSKEGLAFHELRKEDKIDFSTLKKVKAWFVTKGLAEDYVVYLDNVRLLQEGALESNMKIDLPEGALAFDFGENSPLVEGFTEASIIDVYSEEKGFGFVNPQKLVAEGRDWPDPLTGDYISGGHRGDAMAWSPASFEFRVKADNGQYLAWVGAGYYPYPDLYTDLNLNGELLFNRDLSGKRFYSTRGYFRFLKTGYSEKPNALWKNYVSRIFPAYTVETEVKDGVFFVKGMNCYLSALILLPADRRAEFGKLTEQIATERARYFYEDLFLQRPENEPCQVKDADFVLYAPAAAKRVMPWSGIDGKDKQAIRYVATPGEALPFQVALRPFRDIDQVKLSLSELSGPGDSSIPSEHAEVFLKKYMSNGMYVRPWCLIPEDAVTLEKGLSRSFWLRLRIPKGTPSGVYKGAVTASAAGAERKLPVEIKVYPFTLRGDLPLAVGLYYSAPDSGQFALFNRMKDFESARDRMLSEQMELLRDYGMTSTTVPGPRITDFRGSGVLLDFAGIEKVTEAAREAGLHANEKQRAITYTLGLGRTIGGKLSRGKPIGIGAELRLPGFSPAYVSAIRQLVEWGEDTRTPLALWVVDEPREKPNPWNRNLDDTISYLKLTGKVEGALRMVTPMGDQNHGKDYTPMLDHLEIVATHSTSRSRRMIERGMSDPKLELWIYNTGKDRYSNGFYTWRVGATGKHEWHFNQWVLARTKGRYLGLDIHNPFLNYEHTSATVPAPLTYKGALLPKEGLLTMSMGINDYRYLHTLEQAIAECKRKGVKATEVAEAQRFLDALRKVIPVLPEVKNLAAEADLALVGEGIEGGKADLDAWREKVAELIVKVGE